MQYVRLFSGKAHESGGRVKQDDRNERSYTVLLQHSPQKELPERNEVHKRLEMTTSTPSATVYNSNHFCPPLTMRPLASHAQSALIAADLKHYCTTAQQLLLALEYEGTLVPDAPYPTKTFPTPALRAILSHLAYTPRVKVVVVSQRPLSELRWMLPVQGVAYVGSSGIELRTAAGEMTSLLPSGAYTRIIARLQRELTPLVADIPGLLLENTPYTLVLHSHFAQPEAKRALARAFTIVQRYQQKESTLDIGRGKNALIVRPMGIHMGKAIQAVLAPHETTSHTLCIGRDWVGKGTLQILKGRTCPIVVTPPPWLTAVPYALRDDEEVLCFLSHILELRRSLVHT